jgi:adenine nucleotide transporter 17
MSRKSLDAQSAALADAIAGAGAGVFGLLVMYPLDTFKSRKQVQGVDPKVRFGNMYDGLGIGLISEAAQQAAYYYFYSLLRRNWVGKFGQSPGTIASLGIGSVAGAMNMIITLPLGTIHTRMQTAAARNEEKLNGVMEHVRNIWRNEGICGFWSGISTSLILVINPSITFFCFEVLKKYFKVFLAKGGKQALNLSSGWLFLIGAMSKLIATVLTYPLILAKTRLQIDKEKVYKGLFDLYRKIWISNGFTGLYTGMSSKLLQTCAGAALKFMMKDLFDGFAFFIVLNYIARKKQL